jgi:5-hydroxyisourate hydrolase-like protein (transthyretin family)
MSKHHVALLFALMVGVACDPCSGVGSCTTSLPHLTAEGQIVDNDDGKPVDGIRIEMFRVGGPGQLANDQVSTVTSDGGFWRVSTPAYVAESVLVGFRIFTPRVPNPYYAFRWIVPTARKGEAFVSNRWVADPYFSYFYYIVHRADDVIVPNTVVTFHQTGGPRLQGLDANGNYVTHTDGWGYVRFFPLGSGVVVSDTGLVEGEITVEMPPPYGTSKAIVDLYPRLDFRVPAQYITVRIGPSLKYTFTVVDETTGKPVPGVRVDFSRTGGIEIDPATSSQTTDANGQVSISPAPSAFGTVTGKVTLTSPGGSIRSLPVSLTTFDNDSTRALPTWSISP